jgi:hypothetical protein
VRLVLENLSPTDDEDTSDMRLVFWLANGSGQPVTIMSPWGPPDEWHPHYPPGHLPVTIVLSDAEGRQILPKPVRIDKIKRAGEGLGRPWPDVLVEPGGFLGAYFVFDLADYKTEDAGPLWVQARDNVTWASDSPAPAGVDPSTGLVQSDRIQVRW